ncbi:MAG: sterol desaturase/sphingolipid hydroxylase (fatty acid hydroxylase superfamily) [Polaribacter sp.]|jgi:sterol desaturase/sphingolipid hydroxylase (fatty acid hydroxylase superfamily)
MSIIDDLSNSADKGSSASKELINKSFAYSKLKVFQITTLSISMLTKLFVLGGFFFLGFIFIALSGAIALGEYLQNIALGYLAMGLLMLFFMLLLYLFRKYFDKKILTKMSKRFFKESS